MLKEIEIKDYPVILVSDSHTNLSNLRKLKELYPNNLLISLGDFTFLFAKEGEPYNNLSIQYFIDNKIPALRGNHEDFLIASEENNNIIKGNVGGKTNDFNLSKEYLDYLKSLPIGFKLILPNGRYYLLYHNKPNSLWCFPTKKPNFKEFLQTYPVDINCLGVVKGHEHINYVVDFKENSCKLIVLGQLCNSDHHNKNNSGGNYGIITESGFEFKKL